jgi:tryptophan-rich sensory protein
MLALTGADLAVNAGWCWAFFDRESPRAGLATIAVLNGLNLALLREAARRDRAAAAALTPYVVWTGFATALNASIWCRNR